jgi:hypothetical protein
VPATGEGEGDADDDVTGESRRSGGTDAAYYAVPVTLSFVGVVLLVAAVYYREKIYAKLLFWKRGKFAVAHWAAPPDGMESVSPTGLIPIAIVPSASQVLPSSFPSVPSSSSSAAAAAAATIAAPYPRSNADSTFSLSTSTVSAVGSSQPRVHNARSHIASHVAASMPDLFPRANLVPPQRRARNKSSLGKLSPAKISPVTEEQEAGRKAKKKAIDNNGEGKCEELEVIGEERGTKQLDCGEILEGSSIRDANDVVVTGDDDAVDTSANDDAIDSESDSDSAVDVDEDSGGSGGEGSGGCVVDV